MYTPPMGSDRVMWLRQFLRQGFYKSGLRDRTLRRIKIARNTYKCENCNQLFTWKEMKVDHIIPVIDPMKGFENWDIYINRLFCNETNLQGLCLNCHKLKTAEEEKQRQSYGTGRTSFESRQKISIAQKGHTYLKGVPKTEAHIKAMSKERGIRKATKNV